MFADGAQAPAPLLPPAPGACVETTAAALAAVGAEDPPFFGPTWKPEAGPACSPGSPLLPGPPAGPRCTVQPALRLAAHQGFTASLVAPWGICWVWTQNQPGLPQRRRSNRFNKVTLSLPLPFFPPPLLPSLLQIGLLLDQFLSDLG